MKVDRKQLERVVLQSAWQPGHDVDARSGIAPRAGPDGGPIIVRARRWAKRHFWKREASTLIGAEFPSQAAPTYPNVSRCPGIFKTVRSCVKRGEIDRAKQLLLDHFGAWSETNNTGVLQYWARVFMALEAPQAAIRCWSKALDLDRNFLPAWEGLAQQLRYDGKQWRFFYLGIIRDHWESDKLLLEAARNFKRNGDPRLAKDLWMELWGRTPTAEVVRGLTHAWLDLHEYQALEQFTGDNPDVWAEVRTDNLEWRSVESALVNGLVECLNADDDERIRPLGRLLGLGPAPGADPANGAASRHELFSAVVERRELVKHPDRIIDLLERQVSAEQALAFLERLLSETPHDLKRLHRRGRLLLKLERYREVQELYESLERAREAGLISKNSDFHDVFASLAHLHFLKLNGDRALHYAYRASSESERGFGKTLFFLFHLERYDELARVALWLRRRIGKLPAGDLSQLNAASQAERMGPPRKAELRLALGARLRGMRPSHPAEVKTMVKNRAVSLRTMRYRTTFSIPELFHCIEDFFGFSADYGVLASIADFVQVATWNYYTADSLCLDFAAGDQPEIADAAHFSEELAEVFIPDAFFVEADRQTAAHVQIRLIFERLLEELQIRGFRICPRHQLANGICDPMAEGNLVFSYHTRGADAGHWHFKESHLPGFFHFDRFGYSGWSELAQFNRKEAVALRHQLASYDRRSVDGYFGRLVDRFVRGGISKYDQPEAGVDEIAGNPYVLIVLQKIDDTVARFASLSPYDFVPEICRHFAESGMHVVIKRHPFCQSPDILEMLERWRTADHVHVLNASIHELLTGARCVFTVNSGVGFEALLHDKPVVTFGAADYNIATTYIRSMSELGRFLEAGEFVPDPLQRAFVYHYLTRVVVDVADEAALSKRIDEALSEPMVKDGASTPPSLTSEAPVELAEGLLKSGFVEAALRLYDTRVDRRTLSPSQKTRYLGCLRRCGLFDRAWKEVGEWSSTGDLPEAEVAFEQGKIREESGALGGSLAFYAEASRLNPRWFNPRYHGARVALQLGEIEGQIEDLRRLASEHLGNYDVQTLLGRAELAISAHDRAEALWSRLSKTVRGRRERNTVQAFLATAIAGASGLSAAWAYLSMQRWTRSTANGTPIPDLDTASISVRRLRELIGSGDEMAIMLTDATFWRGEGGSHARIQEVIHELKRETGRTVIVLYTGSLSAANVAGLTQYEDAAVFPLLLVPTVFAERPTGVKTRPLTRPSFSKGETAAHPFLCHCLQQVLDRARPSCVVFEYIWMDYLLSAVPAGIPVIMDTHDIHFERGESFARMGRDPHLKISADEELRVLSDYDSVLAISERDDQTLRSLAPELPVVFYPHVPDIQPTTIPLSIRRIGFLGGAHWPNVDALAWLLEEIWPALNDLPLELHLYGNATGSIRGRASTRGVRIHGFVPDIGSVYANCDLIIAPLRMGSGLKIKVVEALAYGRIVVGTGVSFQGLEVDGESTYLAESPADYRGVVEELMANPGRMADGCRAAPEHVRRLGRARGSLVPVPRLNSLQKTTAIEAP